MTDRDTDASLETQTAGGDPAPFVAHLIAEAPPVCFACGGELQRKARPGHRYQAPFIPPDQWCPEHGFPDEQLRARK